MEPIFQEIKRAVKKAKTAVLATHIDPDGDAIGSTLALAILLERLGLAVTPFSADGVPKVYKFLSGSDRIKTEIFPDCRFDLAFVLDSSDLSRIGNKIDLRKMAHQIINIDHHPDNTQFGAINYVKQTSCVAEQIFDLARSFIIKPDKNMAECIYAAMITDTGNFRYDNTSVKTFLVAAELLKAGVVPHEIATRVYDTKSVAAVKITARAMADLKLSKDRKVAWTAVTEEMMSSVGAKGEDIIGIVDIIRSLEGVEVAVFFREDKNKVKINFRSKQKVNVSELARRFGGGGHMKAAGAIVEGPMVKVQERVIEEVMKHLEASKFLI